ncbi:DUF2285 domain-containing protein [Pseudomonas lopnurensis]|uniref:DUF2285 domain-containing protein n=1 Tax=Pseudomonas lopnurensis TaxID=1477517 RepID=UPI0028AD5711|nr:DUF2285 domain-containing protein [Pseudomonas lopnurensis]
MADRSTEPWYPTAAYLYVLHLDGPALAWEYLRRHPDYRLDWLRRRRRADAARRWGLRLLEDPALDARDAQPAWFPDHDTVVQLYPDTDPPPDAPTFAFWRIPGHKRLIHDGSRLLLLVGWPGSCLRFAMASGLEEGKAYAYAFRACAKPCGRYATLAIELGRLVTTGDTAPAAMAVPRPSTGALQELHTLQALDATLAGASQREVAEGVFGIDAAADWHSDGSLRSRVRRLVQRGNQLMRGGYRRLAQIPDSEKGRSASGTDRP